ncbi:hypothetical protein BGX34_001478 [Mortierella sp. NVP85]|nr:hypothetical protein BGX34_001478 [Mortierella sp. NVP85]
MSRKKALFVSYGKDWVLVTIIIAIFTYIDTVEPFHRQFSVKDTTIQHPYAKKETVPVWMAFVLAFVAPGAIIAVSSFFHKKTYLDLHNGLLGLFLTQSLVLVVTCSVKIAVGRPRPDFIDRCLNIYDLSYEGTPLELLSDPVNMLSTSDICTRRDLLRDGFKSFPSSFSFGGLGYLSMYLAGKLHLFDEHGHIYKSMVVIAPLVVAALIATSRVDDYRHHWQDVSVGAFIGMVFAVFSYRQYYPSLAADHCHSPFSPRKFGQLPATLLAQHDEHHPEHNATQRSFLSNVGGTGRDQEGTSLSEMNSSGAKYDPAREFDQSLRAQGTYRTDDTRVYISS